MLKRKKQNCLYLQIRIHIENSKESSKQLLKLRNEASLKYKRLYLLYSCILAPDLEKKFLNILLIVAPKLLLGRNLIKDI